MYEIFKDTMEYYAAIKNQALYMIPIDSISNQRKSKLDFIKFKNFCGSKGMIMKVKRQPTKQAQIFSNHISDKGLLPRIYKHSISEQSIQKS